ELVSALTELCTLLGSRPRVCSLTLNDLSPTYLSQIIRKRDLPSELVFSKADTG
ncbi:hypothetical protein BIW11_11105, partial [Tropilaelaps mercedesae]